MLYYPYIKVVIFMAYKTGMNRSQLFLSSLDEFVSPDSPARVIDAFVDTLDLSNFNYSSPSKRGNRPYNPSDLLKLYLFGYYQGIRSSRKLMHQCKVNIEFMWLLNNLTPDHRTISDFRKDHASLLKDIFFKFNLDCKKLNILSNYISQDGTKLKAVNSKANNFTFSKIDDRKKRIQDHIDSYLKDAELLDSLDDKEELLSKVDLYQSKLDTLNAYESDMLKNGLSQKYLTDPDSKLMKDNGKFTVGYNNQVCVDMKSHLVSNFQISSNPADIGSISSVSKETKDIYGFDILTNVTDKGYADRHDMMNALENGIIPQVTPSKDSNGFTLETDFEDNIITDKIKSSSNSDDIKKCLKAGIIPDVYNDYISSIEVKDVVEYENSLDNEISSLSEDELRDIAINEHCFSRFLPSNKVFCPMGEILRQKSKTPSGIRYYNKLACKNCKNPCTASLFKIVYFSNGKSFVGRSSSKKKSKSN